MKKLPILIILLVVLSGFTSLGTKSNTDFKSADTYILSQIEHINQIERRGCCSHHGGVCGCRNGRALCCDGTLSPTCGCD